MFFYHIVRLIQVLCSKFYSYYYRKKYNLPFIQKVDKLKYFSPI